LTWEAQEGSTVYISNIGRTGASGRITVSPDRTTSYTLIIQGVLGIQTTTTTLRVQGSRDVTPLTDIEHSRFPKTYTIPARPLVDFLQCTHKALQDSMGFSLNEYEDRSTGKLIFATNRSQRGYLVTQGEKGIRARRIAYVVEVTKPDPPQHQLSYTIKAIIEYQRMVEKTWREEASEPLYVSEINRLKEEIGRLTDI
jgi:hypothetical protein